MLGPSEQSAVINAIDLAGGFRHEAFRSAAGIPGNFKIFLPEALQANPEAESLVIEDMAESIGQVDSLVATGGAVDLARKIAWRTGRDLIEISSRVADGKKEFYSSQEAQHQLAFRPNVAFIEDVSSTFDTVRRVIAATSMQDLVSVVVVAWRRGEPAPVGVSDEEVHEHNLKFSHASLYEYPLRVPVKSSISRRVPLWIGHKRRINHLLPELAS